MIINVQNVIDRALRGEEVRVYTAYPVPEDEQRQLLDAAMASGQQIEISVRLDFGTNKPYFLVRRFWA